MTPLLINALWDNEAGVFVATSKDVPGLVIEADSMPDLIAKLKVCVPEMLEENRHLLSEQHLPRFHIVTEYEADLLVA